MPTAIASRPQALDVRVLREFLRATELLFMRRLGDGEGCVGPGSTRLYGIDPAAPLPMDADIVLPPAWAPAEEFDALGLGLAA